MQNYSTVFQEVLNEFESPYVPGDQGDAGKGQVTARAGERINRTLDSNVGYIGKNPGQTQYYGISVDALQDKSDGYGADYLTDELQPDGRRLIKLAYTPYPTPSNPPSTGWVLPTPEMLNHGGPLILKTSPTPEPSPEPSPGKDDEILSVLSSMQSQAATDKAEILARDDENTEKSMKQIRDLIEDVEESLKKAGIILIRRKRNQP